MKHGHQTEQKSLQRLSSWQPMRWTPGLTRLSRLLVPVTLKAVKVRVTRSRMTLLLRWLLDAEQYELMQASCVAVGRDFHDQEHWVGVLETPETGACS